MSFDLDASGIVNTQKKLTKLAKQTITEMAQMQIVQIRQRVAQGRGLNDAAMPRYALSTVESRKRKGRSTNQRNLEDSGTMLRSIHTASITKTGVGYEAIIGFTNAEDALKAAYNQQAHPWFGISPQDAKGLRDLAESYFAQLKEDRA